MSGDGSSFADLTGYLLRLPEDGQRKKKRFGRGGAKKRFFVLVGASLFEYEDEKAKTAKREHVLTGAVSGVGLPPIDEDESGEGGESGDTNASSDASGRDAVGAGHLFFVQPAVGEPLVVEAETQDERDKWLAALGAAVGASRQSAPQLKVEFAQRRRKSTLRVMMEKKLASTALKTKKGRAAVYDYIPEDAIALKILTSVIDFAKIEVGETEAERLEKRIIKLLVKALVLDKNGVLDEKDMLEGLVPLYDLCRATVDCRNATAATAPALVEELRTHFETLRNVCLRVLTPHVTANSTQKVDYVFGYVSRSESLLRLLTDGEMAPILADIVRETEAALPELRFELAERGMLDDDRDPMADLPVFASHLDMARAAEEEEEAKSQMNAKAQKFFGV